MRSVSGFMSVFFKGIEWHFIFSFHFSWHHDTFTFTFSFVSYYQDYLYFQVVQHPLLQFGNHFRAAAAMPLSRMPIQLGHDPEVDVQQVGDTPGRFDVKQWGAIEPLRGVLLLPLPPGSVGTSRPVLLHLCDVLVAIWTNVREGDNPVQLSVRSLHLPLKCPLEHSCICDAQRLPCQVEI